MCKQLIQRKHNKYQPHEQNACKILHTNPNLKLIKTTYNPGEGGGGTHDKRLELINDKNYIKEKFRNSNSKQKGGNFPDPIRK